MVPKVKFQNLNSDRSTIGCFSVSSQMRKAKKPITAMIASTMMEVDENQSASLPVSSMTCSVPTQRISRPSPTVSMGSWRVGVSRLERLVQHRNAAIKPTGTLMRKIQPQ